MWVDKLWHKGAKGHCNTERPGAISCIVICFIMDVSINLQKRQGRQTQGQHMVSLCILATIFLHNQKVFDSHSVRNASLFYLNYPWKALYRGMELLCCFITDALWCSWPCDPVPHWVFHKALGNSHILANKIYSLAIAVSKWYARKKHKQLWET